MEYSSEQAGGDGAYLDEVLDLQIDEPLDDEFQVRTFVVFISVFWLFTLLSRSMSIPVSTSPFYFVFLVFFVCHFIHLSPPSCFYCLFVCHSGFLACRLAYLSPPHSLFICL